MTTYEQRELAGVSPVAQPIVPSESKHTLDNRRDETRLHRREAKELRLLDNPIAEYNYHKELSEVLGNPYNKVKNQLKEGDYRIITEQEALHVPYRHVA